jgi:sugar phosphate isomerase/epimerase
MPFYKSILVSNILDPYTHDSEDLQSIFKRIGEENKYRGVETRVIQEKATQQVFLQYEKELDWDVVLWLTGEMNRMGLNLSSLDETARLRSLEEVFLFIDKAAAHGGQKVGIGSGGIESVNLHDVQLEKFIDSLDVIMNYIDMCDYPLDVILEPQDQFAHKRIVVGNLETCQKLLERIKDKEWFQEGRFSLCWDSAHFALNEDDFEESIRILAPYITNIHFADAVLDKRDPEFGDHHRPFDDKGFMNPETAREILTVFDKYNQKNKPIYVSCEVRTKNEEDAWPNEQKYDQFLEEALKAVKN